MMTDLEQYLRYYSKLKAPGYAVLVTGEWGSGKTYQVKRLLSDNEYYYITLFGIDSVDAIHDAVLAEMAPLVTKARKHLPQLAAPAFAFFGLSSFNALTPGLCRAVFRNKVKIDRTLVFDDLERSVVCTRSLTGALNTYIEHHNCRVIIIAHDEKILDEYQSMKEKTVGHVIRIEPDLYNAYSSFVGEVVNDSNKVFLQRVQEDLVSVFQMSETKSLRILRHVIRDLGRLYGTLEPQHTRNGEAMKELVGLFGALDIEVRIGNLVEKDLRNRYEARFRHLVRQPPSGRENRETAEASVETPPILTANEKYRFVDLGSTLLADNVLVDMLIKGIYNSENIRKSVNSSSYFLEQSRKETPAWKVVWDLDTLEDKDLQDALRRMEEKFCAREVVEPGEMLHIFSLKLMMWNEGIDQRTKGDVVQECKDYVDDVQKGGALLPLSTNMQRNMSFTRAHEGYQYWVQEAYSEEFAELLEVVKRR